MVELQTSDSHKQQLMMVIGQSKKAIKRSDSHKIPTSDSHKDSCSRAVAAAIVECVGVMLA